LSLFSSRHWKVCPGKCEFRLVAERRRRRQSVRNEMGRELQLV